MEGHSRRWDRGSFGSYYAAAVDFLRNGSVFSSLCFAWEYCHSVIASSIWRNHAISSQPNRDLFCSQSKESGGGQAKAGATSPYSYQGLGFLVASCFTSLSLRLLSLCFQDSCFTSRQEEKGNSKGKSSFQLNSNTIALMEVPSSRFLCTLMKSLW